MMMAVDKDSGFGIVLNIGFFRMLPDVALVFLDVHSGCILDLRWGPNHD